ncbi:MAG: hypothetical protein ACK5JC_00510 [Bacteroidota bacterium]
MFHFKNHRSDQPFYHDKAFTLEWNLSHCKWILIRFFNSQRKAWYHSTERNYRFRRLFFGKAKGSFTNLANIHSPFIEVFVFPYWISLPKKHLLPMQVNRLVIHDLPLQTDLPKDPHFANQAMIHSNPINLQIPMASSLQGICHIQIPEVCVSTPPFPQSPICNWPVYNMIAEGTITEETSPKDIHHIMQNPQSYV